MQNKRFYAVLVLAVGIVLAALHVADLLQCCLLYTSDAADEL